MSKETWVGLFTLVGFLLLGGLSFVIDDEGNIFSSGYEKKYFSLVENVGQIGPGAFVQMAGSGVQIGRVDAVTLQEVGERYMLRMDFSIKEEYTIRVDSEVRLAMSTLLTGMHLEISPGTPGAAELPPSTEQSEVPVGKSIDLMTAISTIGEKVEELSDGGFGRMMLGAKGYERIGEVLDNLSEDGGLGKWILGEGAHKNLEPTFEELRKSVENVREGTEGKSTIGRLLKDEELGQKVDEMVTDLRESMKGIRKLASDVSEGKGVIARLLQDEDLGQKLDDIVTDIRGVTADLRAGKSVLSRLVSDEEMGEKLDTVVSGLADMARNLTSGEGTIARLINDPELFTEVRRLVIQAREAVEDAREAAPISAFASLLFGAFQ